MSQSGSKEKIDIFVILSIKGRIKMMRGLLQPVVLLWMEKAPNFPGTGSVRNPEIPVPARMHYLWYFW